MKYKRWDFWHAQTHTVAGHIRGGFVCVWKAMKRAYLLTDPKRIAFPFINFCTGAATLETAKKEAQQRVTQGFLGGKRAFLRRGKLQVFFPHFFKR